jgi:outer membrane protein TolC
MNKKKQFILQATIALFLSIMTGVALSLNTSPVEVGKPLTLKDAIALSLRYNVDVQSQEFQRVADKFSLRVAQNEFELQYALTGHLAQSVSRSSGSRATSRTATLTPSTSLKTAYGTQYNLRMNNAITQSYPGVSNTYNPGLDLTVSQPLLRGAGRAINLTSLYNAEDNELISKLQLRQTLISTTASVIQSYRNLILTQNDVVTAQLALESYQASLDLNKAMVKSGRSAPSEILQASSDYASQTVTLNNAINTVITSKRDLMNLVGLSPNIAFQVPTEVTIAKPDVPNFDQAFAIALANNPSYQQSVLSMNAAERQLMLAKDNSRVRLDMTLDAGTGNGSGGRPNAGFRSVTNNKNTHLGFALDLEVPIDNYQLKQGVVNAQVQLDQAKIQLAQSKRNLERDILNDLNDIHSNEEQIELARTALELQQKNQTAMSTKLRLGLASTLDVSTTQRSLNDARQSLIRTEVNYLNSVTQLYADMGTLLDVWGMHAI